MPRILSPTFIGGKKRNIFCSCSPRACYMGSFWERGYLTDRSEPLEEFLGKSSPWANKTRGIGMGKKAVKLRAHDKFRRLPARPGQFLFAGTTYIGASLSSLLTRIPSSSTQILFQFLSLEILIYLGDAFQHPL
jgi:hypothetical protein